MKIIFNITREVPIIHRTLVQENEELEIIKYKESEEDPNFLIIYFKDGTISLPIHKSTFSIED